MAELRFPEEALPWLAKADSDLRTARAALALDPPETETAGFHCQQAVEKCLKALLVANDVDPPRVHDLEVLLEMCTDQGHDLTDSRAAILDLNPFAVQFRYPTEEPAPEEEEVQAASQTARDQPPSRVPNTRPVVCDRMRPTGSGAIGSSCPV